MLFEGLLVVDGHYCLTILDSLMLLDTSGRSGCCQRCGMLLDHTTNSGEEGTANKACENREGHIGQELDKQGMMLGFAGRGSVLLEPVWLYTGT